MKNLWLPAMSILLLLTACQSMQKLYDAGEYEKAYKAALKELKDKPGDEAALTILENSLLQTLVEDQVSIENLRQQETTRAWEDALKLIDEDQERITATEPYLGDRLLDTQEALAAATAEIRAELYYSLLSQGKGNLEKAIASDDAAVAQRAYYQLLDAEFYSEPNFEAVEQLPELIQSAADAGIVYYQVELNKGQNIGLGSEIESYFSNLEDHSSQFKEIEMVFIASGGDCAIDIDFGSFGTRTEEDVSTEKYETEVVVSYEQEIDTLGMITEIPVYQTVSAEVQTVTSRKIASWAVHVDVDSRTKNCPHFSNRYGEEVVSETAFYRTSGDFRALPQEYQAADQMKQYTPDDDMAEELLDRFYRQICADYFSE